MGGRAVTDRQRPGEVLRIKALVRERDGYACTKCGMTHTEHHDIYGKILDVHRLTPGSLYTVEGSITICRACHGPEPKRKPGEPDLANRPTVSAALDPDTAAELKTFMDSLQIPVPVNRVVIKALREFLVSRGFRRPDARG